jgi:hypothetical protein
VTVQEFDDGRTVVTFITWAKDEMSGNGARGYQRAHSGRLFSVQGNRDGMN